MSQFGNFLREKRGTLAVRDVADELGISKTALSDYETGKQLPPEKLLKIFANVYELSLKELYMPYLEDKYSDPEKRTYILEWAIQKAMSAEERDLVTAFRKLPVEKQKQLLDNVLQESKDG